MFHELISWKSVDKWMPNPHEIVLVRYAYENGESAVITAYRGKIQEGGLPVWIDACDGGDCEDLQITHWAHLPRGPLG